MYIYVQNFHSPIRTTVLTEKCSLLASHNLAPHTRCQSLSQPHPYASSPQCHPLAHATTARPQHGFNCQLFLWYSFSINFETMHLLGTCLNSSYSPWHQVILCRPLCLVPSTSTVICSSPNNNSPISARFSILSVRNHIHLNVLILVLSNFASCFTVIGQTLLPFIRQLVSQLVYSLPVSFNENPIPS